MYIEKIRVASFRCFGPEPKTISLTNGVTTFIGSNGTGKTALIEALLRMFGISGEQRRLRRQDFHIPNDENEPPLQRDLSIEVFLVFPELDDDTNNSNNAVPQFFFQMAADASGKLRCRIKLEATWTDDGSIDGDIETKIFAIKTLDDEYHEDQCSDLSSFDRSKIQMVYVPATRDASSQISNFLKGRIWRAIKWSDKLKDVLSHSGEDLNEAFSTEKAIKTVSDIVKERWNDVFDGGTDTTPIFRPVDLRFSEFIRKVEVVFHPDESGRERSVIDLSDGQRSLFHLSLMIATLDIESKILNEEAIEGFENDGIPPPALTLIAVEEPENNLAPFYLSRIVGQVRNMTKNGRAQAIISTHSASVLGRVEPEEIRYFRLNQSKQISVVKEISLPRAEESAEKFIREAVRAYPELYFAKFVVLGEGSSEEIVLPKLAKSMGVPIDRSFIAVVPLGGRHVNHLWRLLMHLEIPHATLLDFDAGRKGGGWGRVKTVCNQLVENGIDFKELFGDEVVNDDLKQSLMSFDSFSLTSKNHKSKLKFWRENLRKYGVYFSFSIDLDWSMLTSFLDYYKQLPEGQTGPNDVGNARLSVLGEGGDHNLYAGKHDEKFLWYRYLFLGRSKPSTHLRVLGSIEEDVLRERAPSELKKLIEHIRKEVFNQSKETLAVDEG